MARKGGFQGGMGNMGNLMKQAQKMQRQMEEASRNLEEKEYKPTAGGGAVEVVITGKKEIKSITLSPDVVVTGKKELKSLTLAPEVVDPDDIEMLQDLIVAAINEGLRTAAKESEETMSRITGGMSAGLGGFGL